MHTILVTLFLSSTTVWAAEEPIVNLYTWADYVPLDVIRDFEDEFGIKVIYDTYDTDIMLGTKLLAGSSGYDIVGIADLDLQRFMPINAFRPLDQKALPNLANISPVILEKLAFSDPGNVHSMVYGWGSAGVAFNRDMVLARMPDAPLNSAAMVFDPAVVSRFADCGVYFIDDAVSVFGMALVYLGYDINTLNADAFAAAEQVLKSVRPYIRYFESNRTRIDFAAEEVCLGITWSGDLAGAQQYAIEAGLDIDMGYVVPREGSNIWIDTFTMPVDAPHPKNAHVFMNYLMRPEVAVKVIALNQQAMGNAGAKSLAPVDVQNNPIVFPPPEVVNRMHARIAYDLKTLRKVNRIWARVKAGFE